MKKVLHFFTYFLVLLGVISTQSSCKKTWEEPDTSCSGDAIQSNATISDILALSPTGDIVQIEDDLIFEGYVVSSDEAGNFYMTLVLQDAPENPTAGITVSLDRRNAYIDFPVGKKAYIKAKGLFVGKDRGVYKIGVTYESSSGTRIGRIPPSEVEWRVIPSCAAPVAVTPLDVTIPDILANGAQYVNLLVRLQDVEFEKAALCSTFSLPGSYGENKNLEDCAGNKLIVRTSGYADFAQTIIPSGKGAVTGVLGRYKTSRTDEFQLYLRDLNDVQFSQPRCDGTSPSCDASSLTPNATIADVKALLGSNDLVQITQDLVLEVTVTATDKSKNFYRTVYIADQTGGIRLGIYLNDLYLRGYHRGAKLRIKAQGLYVGRRYGEIMLGDIYNGHIGAIDDDIDQDHIFFLNRTEEVQPVEVTVGGLNESLIGSLVKLTGVKFIDEDVNEYFAVSAEHVRSGSPRATNRMLVSCTDGDTVTLRTSGYALFADAHVRYASGDVVGIFGCYDADGNGTITPEEYQIYLRDIYDLHLNNPRCDAPLLLETFGLTEPGADIDLTSWYNYAEAGTRKWTGGYYDGSNNHYAQMSAYRTYEDQNIAWLISPPIAVHSGMTLSFQTAQAYWRHDALKVLISTDFNGFDVRRATWVELPARIATGTDPRHAWIDSGEIDLSAYAGQVVYIAFRYAGSGNYGQTTTYRIDNVKIQ